MMTSITVTIDAYVLNHVTSLELLILPTFPSQ